MKNAEKVIGIIVIDILLLWILIRYYFIGKFYSNPEFFSITYLTIFVVLINLIIFAILHFAKRPRFKIAFLANIFLAPMILLLILTKANQKHLAENYVSGNFKFQDINYSVFINKKKQNFLITKTDPRTNKTNVLAGKIEFQKNRIILRSKTENYIVENDSIKGIEGRNFKLQ